MGHAPFSFQQSNIRQEGNWAGNIVRLDIDCDKIIVVYVYSDNDVV